MASAGGNDCSDGDRTITTIAAEKNPENLTIQSILSLVFKSKERERERERIDSNTRFRISGFGSLGAEGRRKKKRENGKSREERRKELLLCAAGAVVFTEPLFFLTLADFRAFFLSVSLSVASCFTFFFFFLCFFLEHRDCLWGINERWCIEC